MDIHNGGGGAFIRQLSTSPGKTREDMTRMKRRAGRRAPTILWSLGLEESAASSLLPGSKRYERATIGN